MSFKGYRLSTALYRNKDAIKGIVALLGGVQFALGFDWKALLLTLAGGVATLAVKLLMDATDYFFTEVELP
jgi:hypothetical protein